MTERDPRLLSATDIEAARADFITALTTWTGLVSSEEALINTGLKLVDHIDAQAEQIQRLEAERDAARAALERIESDAQEGTYMDSAWVLSVCRAALATDGEVK